MKEIIYKTKSIVILFAILICCSSCTSPSWHETYGLEANEIYYSENIPILIKALDDPSDGVRQKAAQALRKFGPQAAEATPSLIKMLSVEDTSSNYSKSYVRYTAAKTLGSIGQDAKDSLPYLVLALGDEDQNVRDVAKISIKQIDPIGELTATIAKSTNFPEQIQKQLNKITYNDNNKSQVDKESSRNESGFLKKESIICVAENSHVKNGFLVALQEGFKNNNINTKVIKGFYNKNRDARLSQISNGDENGCDAIVFYKAEWGWDIALYMRFASIWVTDFQLNKTIAQTTYTSPSSGGLNKLISARNKVHDMVDTLTAELYGVAPRKKLKKKKEENELL